MPPIIVRMLNHLSNDEHLLRARFFCESIDIYAISNMEGKILDANHAFLVALGYASEELIGKNWFELTHEADHDATERILEVIIETGQCQGFLNRLICKNGDPKLIEWNANIDSDKLRIFSLGRDVSNSRREYENLNRQVSLQRAIIDSAEFSIISTDSKGLIQTYNRHAEHMLGYTKQEVIADATPLKFFESLEVAKYAQELSKGFGESIGEGIDLLLAKARAGLVEERAWTLVRKSGHAFEAHVSITALRNERSEIYAFLFVARDVTEERRVQRLKNEFISTVSHELRTPMTSIRGSLGLIAAGLAGEIPAETKPLIDIAINGTDRLIRLVNDILDIDKIDSGQLKLNPSIAEMAPLIEQAITANRPFAEKHKVSFRITNSIPDIKINVDTDRFAQILDNLLSNAAKYTDEGDEIEVQMSMHANKVRVSVIDHGRGIPESFRSKIFAKFMQANALDKREKGGTGLGLAICKALVERQGGQINFISEEGKGATFFFEFPIFEDQPLNREAV